MKILGKKGITDIMMTTILGGIAVTMIFVGVLMAYQTLACYAGLAWFKVPTDFDAGGFRNSKITLELESIAENDTHIKYTLIMTYRGIIPSDVRIMGYETNASNTDIIRTIYNRVEEDMDSVNRRELTLETPWRLKVQPEEDCNMSFTADSYWSKVSNSDVTGVLRGTLGGIQSKCSIGVDGGFNAYIKSFTKIDPNIFKVTAGIEGENIAKICPTASIFYNYYSYVKDTPSGNANTDSADNCVRTLKTEHDTWRLDFNDGYRKELRVTNVGQYGDRLSTQGTRGALCPQKADICDASDPACKAPFDISGAECEAAVANITFLEEFTGTPEKPADCSFVVLTMNDSNNSIPYYITSTVENETGACLSMGVEFPIYLKEDHDPLQQIEKVLHVYYMNSSPIYSYGLMHYSRDEIEVYYPKQVLDLKALNNATRSENVLFTPTTNYLTMMHCGGVGESCCAGAQRCLDGAFCSGGTTCTMCGGRHMPPCLDSLTSPLTKDNCATTATCNPCNKGYVWDQSIKNLYSEGECVSCGALGQKPCVPSSIVPSDGGYTGCSSPSLMVSPSTKTCEQCGRYCGGTEPTSSRGCSSDAIYCTGDPIAWRCYYPPDGYGCHKLSRSWGKCYDDYVWDVPCNTVGYTDCATCPAS